MVSRVVVLPFLVASVLGDMPRRPLVEFEINLDLAPEERYTDVIDHFKEPLTNFVHMLHADNFLVKQLAKQIVKRRGPENDEFQGEIKGMAQLLNIEVDELHLIQMLYELQTLMIPLVNLTGSTHGTHWEDFLEMGGSQQLWLTLAQSLPRFGCTGIIATDKDDGMVYHARNQDFSFADKIQPLLYTGIYTKGGSEVFRTQSIAGYSALLTGIRKGPNGYAIELNTRYPDHFGGNKEMFNNLFSEKREISGWTKRKVLENHDNYEDAIVALSTLPYSGTEYNIVSGVKKGAILARNPDGLAYQLPLSESKKDYIIMTNFDYVYHDLREKFDPTGGDGFLHPRRHPAEKILDKAEVITPELLFSVINEKAVMAKDTIYQVMINVEAGVWNASLPACTECGWSAEVKV